MAGARFTKPLYIEPISNAAVSASSGAPPYLFRDVTVRVFPLRANMATLTAFVNQYLNMDVPPEIAHFAPSMPYVLLMIMNYGRMSMASIKAQNLGWVAQHEVTFTVPLQRWRKINNKMVFEDWAEVSPFIYVDDQLSLNNGRETYGWNKVSAYIDAAVPLWASDPRANIRQFDLSVVDFAQSYAGADDVRQKLVEIDLDPAPSFLEYPMNARNPWSPLWSIPTAISNAAALAGSALDLMTSSRIRGYQTNQRLDGLGQMAAQALNKMKVALPGLVGSVGPAPTPEQLAAALEDKPNLLSSQITLKQFRNAEDPTLACYQALVDSKIGVDRVNRAGMLGDVNYLRGDSSGGFTVRIHRLDAQPIIETLGIEVERSRDADATPSVARVKPLLPFWLDLDLYYGAGEVICSRAHGASTEPPGIWQDEQPRPPLDKPPPPQDRGAPPPEGSAPPSDAALPPPDAGGESGPAPPSDLEAKPMYNTTLGAAVQAIVGPFHFPDLTVQVYPLLADPAVLAAYVDTQLNTPLKKGGMRSYDLKDMDGNWSFELFGSYVYMIINSYGDQKGEMWSAADNIGSFFKREVSFCIPVKWKDDQGKLVTVALIEPFVYSNDGRAVATDREVNGYNSIRASIESPPDTWLSPSGPVASRAYLKMGVEVFPALNVGQKAQQRTLLEIDGRPADASTDAGSPSEDVIAWNRELIDDLMRKSYLSKAKATEIDIVGALSREILGNGAPLNRLVIKQYRDSAQLDRACYQALIHLTTSISTIYDMREIETPVHIRLHRHPGHELADALGLKIKSSQSVAGEVIDTLAPVRPFWARLAIKEDLGTVACYRPEDSRWRITHPWFAPPEPDATPPPPSPTDDDVAAVDISVNPPPPRRLTGQRPYFRKFWTTGVGPALAPGSRGWGERVVGLRSENARWLRSSLVNDLAWLRVQCEGGVLAGPALAELRSKLSATDSGASGAAVQQSLARLLGRDVQADGLSKQLDALLDANPLAEFCDGLSTHELSKLLHALHAAVGAVLGHVIPAPQGVAPEKPSKTSADARVVAFSDDLARVHAWLHKICADADKHANAEVVVLTFQGLLRANAIRQSFADIIDAFERAPELNQKAMLSVFPRSTRELLAELGDFTLPRLAATPSENVGVLFDNMNAVSNNIDRAERLGMICREAFAPWATPSAWLRIVHGPNSPPVEGLLDACSAVDGLDEVQLVIDRILSARWEDRGLPAVMPPEFLRASEELGPAALERGLRAEPPASDAPASTVWVDTSL